MRNEDKTEQPVQIAGLLAKVAIVCFVALAWALRDLISVELSFRLFGFVVFLAIVAVVVAAVAMARRQSQQLEQRRFHRRKHARKIAKKRQIENVEAQLNKRQFGSRLRSYVNSAESGKPCQPVSKMRFWQRSDDYRRVDPRPVGLIRMLLKRLSKTLGRW